MTHHENLKILAFVGLAGAGKSTAVEHFTEKGYPKVYFGGVIYEAMETAGIERTAESEQAFRENYRVENGKDAVAKKIIEQIENLANAGQHRIIADGLYSWSEYKALKQAFHGNVIVVAVVAPRHLRYNRLKNRPERPYTEEESYQRDITQIENIEQGGPIAIADHYIINTGSFDTFNEQLDTLTAELAF